MNSKSKNKLWRIFKIIWLIIGIIISSNALFWVIKKSTYTGAYFITVAIFHAIGIFLLVLYLIITLLIILIKQNFLKKFYQKNKK